MAHRVSSENSDSSDSPSHLNISLEPYPAKKQTIKGRVLSAPVSGTITALATGLGGLVTLASPVAAAGVAVAAGVGAYKFVQLTKKKNRARKNQLENDKNQMGGGVGEFSVENSRKNSTGTSQRSHGAEHQIGSSDMPDMRRLRFLLEWANITIQTMREDLVVSLGEKSDSPHSVCFSSENSTDFWRHLHENRDEEVVDFAIKIEKVIDNVVRSFTSWLNEYKFALLHGKAASARTENAKLHLSLLYKFLGKSTVFNAFTFVNYKFAESASEAYSPSRILRRHGDIFRVITETVKIFSSREKSRFGLLNSIRGKRKENNDSLPERYHIRLEKITRWIDLWGQSADVSAILSAPKEAPRQISSETNPTNITIDGGSVERLTHSNKSSPPYALDEENFVDTPNSRDSVTSYTEFPPIGVEDELEFFSAASSDCGDPRHNRSISGPAKKLSYFSPTLSGEEHCSTNSTRRPKIQQTRCDNFTEFSKTFHPYMVDIRPGSMKTSAGNRAFIGEGVTSHTGTANGTQLNKCNASEKPPWDYENVDLDKIPEYLLNTWGPMSCADLLVRGATYLTDRKKAFSSFSLMDAISLDIFYSDEDIINATAHPGTEAFEITRRNNNRHMVVINFRMPPLHLVCTFIDAVPECNRNQRVEVAYKLLKEMIVSMTPENVRSHLKLLPCVVKGPWLVQKAVGQTPSIIGKKIEMSVFRTQLGATGNGTRVNATPGDDLGEGAFCLECSMNIFSSTAAKAIVGVVAPAARRSILNVSFIVEGSKESELPEKALGGFSLRYTDLSRCRWLK